MVDQFKSSTPDINLIAREIALELGDSTHRPMRRLYISGIATKAADVLSRQHQPGKLDLPDILAPFRRQRLLCATVILHNQAPVSGRYAHGIQWGPALGVGQIGLGK